MTLRDGRVISHTVEDMRGTRRNPMTRADFIRKFTSNTHDLLPKDVLDLTIGELLDVEKTQRHAADFRADRPTPDYFLNGAAVDGQAVPALCRSMLSGRPRQRTARSGPLIQLRQFSNRRPSLLFSKP